MWRFIRFALDLMSCRRGTIGLSFDVGSRTAEGTARVQCGFGCRNAVFSALLLNCTLQRPQFGVNIPHVQTSINRFFITG
jgi:hypothetical protein